MRKNKLKIAQNRTGEYSNWRGFSAVPGAGEPSPVRPGGAGPKPGRDCLVNVKGVGLAGGRGDAAVGGRQRAVDRPPTVRLFADVVDAPVGDDDEAGS